MEACLIVFVLLLLLLAVKLHYFQNIISKKNFEIKTLKDDINKQQDEFKKVESDYKDKLKQKDNRIKKAIEVYNKQKSEIECLVKQMEYLAAGITDTAIPQEVRYIEILQKIEQGKNIFITSGAGVGKSYIVNKLKEKYGDNIVLTASTGVAACNINGYTIHSFSGIGKGEYAVNDIINSIYNGDNKKLLRETIRTTKMLVIDEISMLNVYLFEMIDKVFRKVRNNNKPFGGIQIIAVGDFYQLPPVVDKELCVYKCSKHNSCNKTGEEKQKCGMYSFVFDSPLFDDFEVIELEEIRRQKTDKVFAAVLNRFRVGENVDNAKFFFEKNIIPEDEADKLEYLHLYGRNKSCMEHNNRKLKENPNKVFRYISSDKFIPKDDTVEKIPDADIKKYLNKNSKFLQKLELKKDCRVILIWNIDTDRGLVNGAMGTVKECRRDSVDVEFDDGKKLYSINKVEISLNTPEGTYTRTQIPLLLGYAITIHKSQGLTLESGCIDMKEIFAEGQMYVALSRFSKMSGLKIIDKFIVKREIGCNQKVKEFYAKNTNKAAVQFQKN